MLSKVLNIQVQIVRYRFVMHYDQQTKGNMRFCIRTEASTSVLLLLVSGCLLSIIIILWTPRLAAGVTTPNSVHFITYENSTYGIHIQYPSNCYLSNATFQTMASSTATDFDISHI